MFFLAQEFCSSRIITFLGLMESLVRKILLQTDSALQFCLDFYVVFHRLTISPRIFFGLFSGDRLWTVISFFPSHCSFHLVYCYYHHHCRGIVQDESWKAFCHQMELLIIQQEVIQVFWSLYCSVSSFYDLIALKEFYSNHSC